MSSYELIFTPVRPQRNAVTGRFMKGHVPANKGKKWADYMTKRQQKNASKGWANLEKFRPKHRPDNAGRCRKAVIAVTNDGVMHFFPFIGAAAAAVNGSRENVRRCCQSNHQGKSPKGRINTDHKYKGVRFYFESDTVWIDKVKRQ